MHVCHFVNTLALGGAQKVVVDLVRHADDHGIDQTVCYIGADDARRPEFEAVAPVVSFGARRLTDLRFLPDAAAFFREADPDVVHLHQPHARTWGRILSRLTSAHVVATYHNPPAKYHPLVRLADRLTRPLEGTSVAVSKSVEERFRDARSIPVGPGRSRWTTVPNGIDVAAFESEVRAADGGSLRDELGVADDDPLFLNVGRCTAQKRQADLVRAMASMEVVTDGGTAPVGAPKLVVVGDGPLRSDLEATVDRLGLDGDVFLPGEVRP